MGHYYIHVGGRACMDRSPYLRGHWRNRQSHRVRWLPISVVCNQARTRLSAWWTRPAPLGKWETLVQKVLFYVGRRRRISLAFNAYRGSSLRNTPAAKPNAARRAARAWANTPRAVPFSCFTVFGPHGQRMLRRQTYDDLTLRRIRSFTLARSFQVGE